MPKFNESSALLLTRAIEAGITSPSELANIMGNAAVETDRFSSMHEGFNYRSAERLVSQVSSAPRRYTWDEIRDAVASKDPERIATIMYENRRDLGNTEIGDGWKYHGRGYFQYTGRYNYTIYGEKFGVDLQGDPDQAAEPEMAAKLAIAYWKEKVPEHARHDARMAGEVINGGSNGAEDRIIASQQWAEKITPELVESIRSGKVTLDELAARDFDDPLIGRIQKNLNTLGIPDARGQPLVVDGNRGGPGSRTNEAIAAFQQKFGLDGEMSNAALLSATQVALNTDPARNFEQAMRGILPEAAEPTRMVNGMPDYLLPGRYAPGQGAPAPHAPRHAGPPSGRDAMSAPAEPVRLPPMPPVEQLQPGDRGAAVLALQAHLRLLNARDAEGRDLQADRDYGPRTQEAVENFQLWSGLPTTGAADRATLDALQTHAAYALQQRTQGIAPAAHLADNLKPSAPEPVYAADPRPVLEREVTQTIPAASTPVPPEPTSSEQAPIPSQQTAPQAATSQSGDQARSMMASLQSGLIQLGYHQRISQPLQVNGSFDDVTRQAVTAFQAQQNLPITSSFDLATQQALQQALLAQQQAAEQKQAEDKPVTTRRARTNARPSVNPSRHQPTNANDPSATRTIRSTRSTPIWASASRPGGMTCPRPSCQC